MQQITLKIDGMMCGMCESHINESIRNNFSVKKVTSSHTKGETVILTENDLNEAKLKETIDKTGYKLLSVSKAPYEKKKGFFSPEKIAFLCHNPCTIFQLQYFR